MDYLKYAVDSVLKQSYKNFELLIVNDASTDKTKIYLETLKDKRIKIIHHQTNKKLPAALNTGFKAASGSLFTWISSDNICERDFLKTMLAMKSEYPESSFLYTDYYLINEQGNIMKDMKSGAAVRDGVFSGGGYRYSFLKSIVANGGVAAFLYDRLNDQIGEYDETLNGTEDWDYWIRIAAWNPFMSYLSKPMMMYRIHPRSMTSQMKNTRSERENRMMKKRLKMHGSKRFSIHLLFPTLRFSYRPNLDLAYHQAAVELMKGKYTKLFAGEYIKMISKPQISSKILQVMILIKNKKSGLAKETISKIRRNYDVSGHEIRLEVLENFEKMNKRKLPSAPALQGDGDLLFKESLVKKAYSVTKYQKKTLGILMNEEMSKSLHAEHISGLFDPLGMFSRVHLYFGDQSPLIETDNTYLYHSSIEMNDLIQQHQVSMVLLFDVKFCSLFTSDHVPIVLVVRENGPIPLNCLKNVNFYLLAPHVSIPSVDPQKIFVMHPNHFQLEKKLVEKSDFVDFLYLYERDHPEFDQLFVNHLEKHTSLHARVFCKLDDEEQCRKMNSLPNLHVLIEDPLKVQKYVDKSRYIFWNPKDYTKFSIDLLNRVLKNPTGILIAESSEFIRNYVENHLTAILHDSKTQVSELTAHADHHRETILKNLKTFANPLRSPEIHLTTMYRLILNA